MYAIHRYSVSAPEGPSTGMDRSRAAQIHHCRYIYTGDGTWTRRPERRHCLAPGTEGRRGPTVTPGTEEVVTRQVKRGNTDVTVHV